MAGRFISMTDQLADHAAMNLAQAISYYVSLEVRGAPKILPDDLPNNEYLLF